MTRTFNKAIPIQLILSTDTVFNAFLNVFSKWRNVSEKIFIDLFQEQCLRKQIEVIMFFKVQK